MSNTIGFNVVNEGRAARKLKSFGAFEKGWLMGEGEEFSGSVIRCVERLIDECDASGINRTNVFPGPNGEIALTMYNDNSFLQFTVNEDLTIDYVKKKDKREVDSDEEISFVRAKEIIREFACDLYEYSTLDIISTLTVASLTTSLLSRRGAQREFRLSRLTA